MKCSLILCLTIIIGQCTLQAAQEEADLAALKSTLSGDCEVKIRRRRISTIDAITQNDLEKAIRSLDVLRVEQIIKQEIFTQREYDRYLDLAEKVVRDREIWLRKTDSENDVTTPYEGPSIKRLILECLSGYALMEFSSQLSYKMHLEEILTRKEPAIKKDIALIVSFFAGIALFGKFFYDCIQRKNMWVKRNELIRKKYDDAITIKQLMYATYTETSN